MTKFTIKLAGIPIGVTALHETTENFCRDYITDEVPVFSVELTQQDIDNERQRSYDQDELDGIGPREFSDRYLETLALYRKIAVPMLDHDTVIFHGSVIAHGGKAYLFTAPSGTGKTTHVRLWLSEIPDTHVLNGDKPLLKFAEGKVFACGTPWQGKENYGCNEILPLEAIVLLERAEVNSVRRVDLNEAFPVLLRQTHRPDEPELMLKTLPLIGRMESAHLYRLGCNMDKEAAIVCHDAII